jgi:hypothetical protein
MANSFSEGNVTEEDMVRALRYVRAQGFSIEPITELQDMFVIRHPERAFRMRVPWYELPPLAAIINYARQSALQTTADQADDP